VVTEQKLEDLIRQVLSEMQPALPGKSSAQGRDTISIKDYPLGEKRQELLRTPLGKSYTEISLENVLSSKITPEDLRISAETLEMQARIAQEAGRKFFTENLYKAAEMTRIPDERLIAIYDALRPKRSTKEELLAIAGELENKYQARRCAEYVREAVTVYERRRLLRAE